MPPTMLPADRGMLESSVERLPDRDPPEGHFPERELHLGWFDWLTARRRIIYSVVAALYVLSFNGLWRVGVDSALYRGLARSLVRGEGYVFAGEHHRHAYPGLPFMLAGLEKLFGESAVPGLILMTVLSIATLWLIDRTIALRYPLWVATVVTIGVGLNYQLFRQSQQLMTDVPFAFGVMLSMYALERVRLLPDEARWPAFGRWAIALLAGLGIAAATRPTFGVLALAVVFGSAFRMIRGTDRRRWLHASILSAAIFVLLALFLFDPRARGLDRFTGDRYEQELMQRVGEISEIIRSSINELLGRHLDDLFFSQRLAFLAYPAALTLLVGGCFVLRRNVVWGLMIFGLVAITLPLSTVPRYFIMVAPFLWLGWIILACKLTLKLPRAWQGPVCAIVILFPMLANGARCVGFVIEQRKPDFAWLLHGQSREDAFYATYRDGAVPRLRHMAQMIADHTTPQQTVIGPEAHVLAYYADRRVIGERTLFIDREAAISQWPKLVRDAKPDFVIFPYGAYGENDALMREIIRRRILIAELEVAKVGDVFLASASIRLPPEGVKWRDYKAPPESRAGSTTRSTTGPTTKRGSVRKGSATQRADLIAQRERRAQKEAKIRRAEKQERIEKQARADRRERLAKIEKQKRIERREKIERRERMERRQRQERQKKERAAQAGGKSQGPPTTAPVTPPAIHSATDRPTTSATTTPATTLPATR